MSNTTLEQSIFEAIEKKRIADKATAKNPAPAKPVLNENNAEKPEAPAKQDTPVPATPKVNEASPKNKALAARLKKAFSKVPKATMAKAGPKARKARERVYGESLKEICEILSRLKEGVALSENSYNKIKDGLMEHLFHAISEGADTSIVYQVVLHDVAPLMQVIESVMENGRMTTDRDRSILEAYSKYVQILSEEIDEFGNEITVGAPVVDDEGKPVEQPLPPAEGEEDPEKKPKLDDEGNPIVPEPAPTPAPEATPEA